MGSDTCQYPTCDESVDGKFCSTEHQVKFEHIRADAEDARRSEEPEDVIEKKDLPECDGPPY